MTVFFIPLHKIFETTLPQSSHSTIVKKFIVLLCVQDPINLILKNSFLKKKFKFYQRLAHQKRNLAQAAAKACVDLTTLFKHVKR